MIRITSRNGYTGVLSGESTLTVYDSHGNKVLHTGARNIISSEELTRLVDEFPAMMQTLKEGEVTP